MYCKYSKALEGVKLKADEEEFRIIARWNHMILMAAFTK